MAGSVRPARAGLRVRCSCRKRARCTGRGWWVGQLPQLMAVRGVWSWGQMRWGTLLAVAAGPPTTAASALVARSAAATVAEEVGGQGRRALGAPSCRTVPGSHPCPAAAGGARPVSARDGPMAAARHHPLARQPW